MIFYFKTKQQPFLVIDSSLVGLLELVTLLSVEVGTKDELDLSAIRRIENGLNLIFKIKR